MGSNHSELVKFIVADLCVTNLGENGEFREKSPNLWEKYEFE
jgi:hypothetical protein